MGALQAYEWAVAYPDMVERIVPVIGAAGGDPFLVAWLDVWAQPIRARPEMERRRLLRQASRRLEGLKAALKIVTLHANGAEWAAKTFGHRPGGGGQGPGRRRIANRFKIEAALDAGGAAARRVSDANHFLYLVKANQLAAADPAKIKAPTLIDLHPDRPRLPAGLDRAHRRRAPAAGTPVETATIVGPERPPQRRAPHRARPGRRSRSSWRSRRTHPRAGGAPDVKEAAPGRGAVV